MENYSYMKRATIIYYYSFTLPGKKQAVFTLRRVKSWFLHKVRDSKTSAHGVVFLILDWKLIIAEWKQVRGYYEV